MKQEFKNAAAPALSRTARMVLNELQSGYGDKSGMLKAYKEVAGVRLFATTTDAQKEEVFALIEVESEQASPDGSQNARIRTNYTITAEDAAALVKTAPGEFREQLQRVADNLARANERQFPGRDARRERERLQKIEDMARQVKKAIPAPAPASFVKKRS